MKIAVFCGSAMGTEPAFRDAAARLGQRIGAEGHTLIYGGGDAGLMGILAEAAFHAGAPVIGVIPDNVAFISGREQPWVTELVRAKDMSERKQIMLDRADLFIALPGGVGTLDEMTEAITLTRIGVFHKDCIFLNEPFLNEPFLNEPYLNGSGFYESQRQMFRRMIQAGFLEEAVFDYVKFETAETVKF